MHAIHDADPALGDLGIFGLVTILFSASLCDDRCKLASVDVTMIGCLWAQLAVPRLPRTSLPVVLGHNIISRSTLCARRGQFARFFQVIFMWQAKLRFGLRNEGGRRQ
jgi:hypothetical protein